MPQGFSVSVTRKMNAERSVAPRNQITEPDAALDEPGGTCLDKRALDRLVCRVGHATCQRWLPPRAYQRGQPRL
jgi:hypothetical protein